MIKRESLIVKVLIKHIKQNQELYKSFNFTYHTQKYRLDELLTEILYVLKTGIDWRSIKSHINWNTIYKTYIKLNKNDIFKYSYVQLLKKYIKRTPDHKLKFILSDTSFIQNKNGILKIDLN